MSGYTHQSCVDQLRLILKHQLIKPTYDWFVAMRLNNQNDQYGRSLVLKISDKPVQSVTELDYTVPGAVLTLHQTTHLLISLFEFWNK